jgi:CRP-like cAMP-binding protein
MSISGFFQYPTEQEGPAPSNLLFLSDCDEKDWEKLLSYVETQLFRAGEIIMNEGDRDDALSIVQSGQVEVLSPPSRFGKVRRIALMGAGAVMGEQSFLDGQPRSAAVQALTDVELCRLSHQKFTILAAREPQLALRILMDLGRILSLRLREAVTTNSRWGN